MSDAPVWVWRHGESQPVACGDYSLDGGMGRFRYRQDYQDSAASVPLDPVALPFTRSQAAAVSQRLEGLFGVMRDACPEGWALDLLQQEMGRALTPFERLEHAAGDAVGAIAVGTDIQAKADYQAQDSSEYLDRLSSLDDEMSDTRAAQALANADGSSLGGERPKATLMHKGQLWIAKLRSPGEQPHVVAREYAAMRIARELGLNVCDVEHVYAGRRPVLMIRRFDREVGEGGVQRRLYASAHTVLGLDVPTRDDPKRSYVRLSQDLGRWCGSTRGQADHVRQTRMELWCRMAFNAVCGNGDDHPRNHGFIHNGELWFLAPAFDIAPHDAFKGVLAMAVTRSGDFTATYENLLSSCEAFEMPLETAVDFIETSIDATLRRWPELMRECGTSTEHCGARDPRAWLGARPELQQFARKSRVRSSRRP